MGILEQHLGRRLQELRTNADLTQQELADKARLDWKYLAAIENGRKSPSLAVLARLMHALDVEPPEVFCFKLKGNRAGTDRTAEAITALVRRLGPAERRLILNMIRGALRGGEKKQ